MDCQSGLGENSLSKGVGVSVVCLERSRRKAEAFEASKTRFAVSSRKLASSVPEGVNSYVLGFFRVKTSRLFLSLRRYL